MLRANIINIFPLLQSCRARYLPIFIVYLSYGFAVQLTYISQIFWTKNYLTLSPVQLMQIGFWTMVPWTLKIVLSQAVENISIFASKRRSYIIVGGLLVLVGNLIMAGAANNLLSATIFGNIYQQILISGIFIQTGLVMQDLIADTLCAELVDEELGVEKSIDAAMSQAPQIRKKELGRVQSLGRMLMLISSCLAFGVGGYLGSKYEFKNIVWLDLIAPIISICAAFFLKAKIRERNEPNYKIILPGLSVALATLLLDLLEVPYNQEITFFINLALVSFVFKNLSKNFSKEETKKIILTGFMFFAFELTPELGPAINWWQIDVLAFDQQFFASLKQVAYILSFLGIWLFSTYISKHESGKIVIFVTLIKSILFLPYIGMAFGLHEWTLAHLGFGAKTIAIIDIARSKPSDAIMMVAAFTIAAFYAPKNNKPTWFALVACFFNVSISGHILGGKILNSIFVIERGHYEQIPSLLITNFALTLIIPLMAVFVCRRALKG